MANEKTVTMKIVREGPVSPSTIPVPVRIVREEQNVTEPKIVRVVRETPDQPSFPDYLNDLAEEAHLAVRDLACWASPDNCYPDDRTPTQDIHDGIDRLLGQAHRLHRSGEWPPVEAPNDAC